MSDLRLTEEEIIRLVWPSAAPMSRVLEALADECRCSYNCIHEDMKGWKRIESAVLRKVALWIESKQGYYHADSLMRLIHAAAEESDK